MIVKGTTEILPYVGGVESEEAYKGSVEVYKKASAIPYITDGLVFYVDGINKGNVSGSWKDLVGGLVFTGTDVVSTTKGFSFNGTSSNFCCDSVFAGSADYTIEVCFKSDALPNPFCIFGIGDNTQYNLLFYRSNNYITFLQRANTYTIPLSNGQGYSISLNLDRGLVNGASITKNSGTDYWGNSNSYIGKCSQGRYYSGEIYAIRIYNRKLTEAEQRTNFAIDNQRFELGVSE